MYTGARKKIIKEKNAEPNEFERQVAQAIFDLEVNADELKGDLKALFIAGARQVDVGGGKSAIVIFVPYRLLKGFHKIQGRLIRELEKKFSGQHVIFVANRKILPPESPNNRTKRQKRPRSRTLTSVHNAILDDLVYPTEIVGKRIRVRYDTSRVIKVYLDPKEKQTVAYKLDTFSKVYKRLTGKEVVFLFPENAEAK